MSKIPEDVTRQDLIDWFGTDNDMEDLVIADLNDELNDARMQIFEHFGF